MDSSILQIQKILVSHKENAVYIQDARFERKNLNGLNCCQATGQKNTEHKRIIHGQMTTPKQITIITTETCQRENMR